MHWELWRRGTVVDFNSSPPEARTLTFSEAGEADVDGGRGGEGTVSCLRSRAAVPWPFWIKGGVGLESGVGVLILHKATPHGQ